MPEIREAPIDRYYSPQIPINKSREEISSTKISVQKKTKT
jgi:hypothetical protein